jgi:histidine triad (HIT) family protein
MPYRERRRGTRIATAGPVNHARHRTMANVSPCIFCEIVARHVPATIVFEDDDHLAFFPLEHINPGHLVLIPKWHIDYLFDMKPPRYQALWAAAAQLAPGLRSVTSAKRIAVAVEGFAVPHVHIHLVPVYAGNDLDPSRAKPLPVAEAERLAGLLREVFRA